MRCCRYISEDYGGVALHPIDIMDASSGRLLRSLTDGNLTTISPVNKPHPRRDIIISGSSRWAPELWLLPDVVSCIACCRAHAELGQASQSAGCALRDVACIMMR